MTLTPDNAWAEVDQWAKTKSAAYWNTQPKARHGWPGWRAIAEVPGPRRVFVHEHSGELRLKRPCHYRPGAWRAAVSPALSIEQTKAVRVLRDEWLAAGGASRRWKIRRLP